MSDSDSTVVDEGVVDERVVDDKVECHNCGIKYFIDQTIYTKEEISRIEEYICSSCEISGDLYTKWKVVKPNRIQSLIKRMNYFEVERIVKHKFIRRRGLFLRVFRVKWKNYSPSENSWLPEKSLDGCLDLLQKYLKDNYLAPSTIRGLLGASSKHLEVNEENWVSMETILEQFRYFKHYYFADVEINGSEWNDFEDKDSVYFLSFERHCYVILYYHSQKCGYIADGGNTFQQDESTSTEIRALLNIELKICHYPQQTKMDHCGSSAVLIALEMVRAYRIGLVPSTLTSPSSFKKRIRSRMHKQESTSFDTGPLHAHCIQFHCETCGKAFRSANRRGYYLHLRFCQRKVQTQDETKP